MTIVFESLKVGSVITMKMAILTVTVVETILLKVTKNVMTETIKMTMVVTPIAMLNQDGFAQVRKYSLRKV